MLPAVGYLLDESVKDDDNEAVCELSEVVLDGLLFPPHEYNDFEGVTLGSASSVDRRATSSFVGEPSLFLLWCATATVWV